MPVSCGNFRKKSGALQQLKAACSFAFNADTAGWVGNTYVPERGAGALTRGQASQITGKIGEAQDFGIPNKALNGNAILNESEDIKGLTNNNPTSFFLSFWTYRKAYNQQEFVLIDATNTNFTEGYAVGFNIQNQKHTLSFNIIGKQANSSLANYNEYIEINQQNFPINTFNHVFMGWDELNKKGIYFINGLERQPFLTTGQKPIIRSSYTSEFSLGKLKAFNINTPCTIDLLYFLKNITPTQQQVNTLYNNGNGIQLFP